MVNPDWQRLVEENLELACSVAWRYIRKGWDRKDPAIDAEDLVALACEGLVRAAMGYDPALGWRFSTYAVAHITGRIRKAFNRHCRGVKVSDRLPRHLRPSVCSLDVPVGEDGGSALGDLVAVTGHTDVEDAVLTRDALARLPVRLQQLLRLRAEGWTQLEVSRRLGMTQANVSRLEQRAKQELRVTIGG